MGDYRFDTGAVSVLGSQWNLYELDCKIQFVLVIYA